MSPVAAKVEGWIKKLEGDRVEIFLKAEQLHGQPDRKIRCSGPSDEMFELVDWFEQKTGLQVDVPNRPRSGPRPIDGQIGMTLDPYEDGSPDA